jgi:valyl-tRNA synthetase
MEIPKNYDFTESEKKWMNFWEEQKIFENININEKTFSIDTPPPTVSGKMHIGHAFSYSQGDMIARYKRMKIGDVFFPFGTDDNGLPTEKLVEALKKVKSKKMSRDEFIKLCNETIKEIKPDFVEDWKKIGMSCDFTNSYSTIDNTCIKTSQLSFIDLFKKGRVYQEESPVSWCVNCQTAIAQAEFDNVDMKSNFNDIIFHHGSKELVISTTRPELLAACVALFAHPADERYSNLKGKFAKVPLFDYEVPILFDESVSIEKGTGLMMVCTFGDKEDVEKWHKYKLPLKNVITSGGLLNKEAKQYEGMNIKDARKKIIEDLKEKGLLINQKEITHAVNVHERCGTEVEIIKTKQWFIKVLDKKKELLDAANKIEWYPEFMKKRYIHWVENLQWDWCISRQRSFGVPFPIWYSKKTKEIIIPEEDELPINPLSKIPKKLPKGHSEDDLIPESDVMDTWATSSVTPQIALGWAENSQNFKKGFPMTLRLQAHDIIRTWAFYTITKAVFNNETIPWEDIAISGFVLDPKGEKMSKSKGNTIQPQPLLDQFGADALRFWAASSKLGEDLPYQEKDVLTGKKTVTKLWNASKFVFMNLEDFKDHKKDVKEFKLKTMDKWLLSKLMKTIKASTTAFDKYEYSRSKHETDIFFWQSFCDNYLEFVKHRTYQNDEDIESKTAAQSVLYFALLQQIKLFAPIMPFITEEIYQLYFKDNEQKKSVHISQWPQLNKELIDEESEKAGDLAVKTLAEIRKHKSMNKMSLKAELKQVTIHCTEQDKKLLSLANDDLLVVGRVEEFIFKEAEEFSVSF